MRLRWEDDEDTAAACGMLAAWQAQGRPHDVALYSDRGNLSFRELDSRANQFARLCRDSGLGPGDAVAILTGNIPEFVQVMLGCLRSGLRLTPVSWRLEPRTISTILADCEPKVLVADPSVLVRAKEIDFQSVQVRLAVGGGLAGFLPYEMTGQLPDDPPEKPVHGQFMLYTSGTTGPPKGVRRSGTRIFRAHRAGTVANYQPGDRNLLTGPVYHGASLYHDLLAPILSGAPVVMHERFEAGRVLETIDRQGITHMHMVSTMFHRLLALPEQDRRRHDTSSLRSIIHGAGPTAPAVKRAMIDWFGPILTEYYAATEGSPGLRISSEEWLRKPGSVGKVKGANCIRVLGPDGSRCPPGVEGDVYLPNGADGVASTYHRNPAETDRVFEGSHFCVGDVGYIDDDGYLFLTGRTADRIISGGVNIQPLEIDLILRQHPDVEDACCIGAPNAEWGEEVRAVVIPRRGVSDLDGLREGLLGWAAERLAAFKAPRSVEFVSALPYSETGKLQRAQVRLRYWKAQDRNI